ncbi:MAG TPA: flagellar motor switch protein FliN [Rheinheimera sp.]|uniref:FliM/FliN family flagellar motor switch protein n=1 Tax=Rheinheimera sp. TaxID=1869214 RepID=UPI000EE3DE80|nr:FliM/FliN family flagellar motor switch protein [Rheinheimera sp.]HCU65772.1 flagellar motor switch protein FliN [Rheinheimera sp.]
MKHVEEVEYSQVDSEPVGEALVPVDINLIGNLTVALRAEIGSCELSVAELYQVKKGQVLSFNSKVADLIELKLEGNTVARGRLVALDGYFALEIVDTAVDGLHP